MMSVRTFALSTLSHKLEMDKIANKVLPAKDSSKGLELGQILESFILLCALGGECLDDMKRLRDDVGLEEILCYRSSVPEADSQWFDIFHDEKLLHNQPLLGIIILSESGPLASLKEENRCLVEVTGDYP
jgi:hypothetical protein